MGISDNTTKELKWYSCILFPQYFKVYDIHYIVCKISFDLKVPEITKKHNVAKCKDIGPGHMWVIKQCIWKIWNDAIAIHFLNIFSLNWIICQIVKTTGFPGKDNISTNHKNFNIAKSPNIRLGHIWVLWVWAIQSKVDSFIFEDWGELYFHGYSI